MLELPRAEVSDKTDRAQRMGRRASAAHFFSGWSQESVQEND
jgi:hypothetical protein